MGAVDVGAAGREVAHADETIHSRDRLQWYRGSVACVSELLVGSCPCDCEAGASARLESHTSRL